MCKLGTQKNIELLYMLASRTMHKEQIDKNVTLEVIEQKHRSRHVQIKCKGKEMEHACRQDHRSIILSTKNR